MRALARGVVEARDGRAQITGPFLGCGKLFTVGGPLMNAAVSQEVVGQNVGRLTQGSGRRQGVELELAEIGSGRRRAAGLVVDDPGPAGMALDAVDDPADVESAYRRPEALFKQVLVADRRVVVAPEALQDADAAAAEVGLVGGQQKAIAGKEALLEAGRAARTRWPRAAGYARTGLRGLCVSASRKNGHSLNAGRRRST